MLFAIVASTIVATGIVYAAIMAKGFALDFGVFWETAREPIGGIYRPDPWLPFVYPPTSIPWLKPLALLPFWPAFVGWSVLSLAVYLIAVPQRTCWLILLSPALIECIAFGQTSLFVGALVLWSCSRRGWPMGALLAVALSLKPQMLVTAPLILFFRRDWAAIAGGVVTGVALILLTTALFGFGIWRDWAQALRGFAHVVDARNLYWATITPYGLAAWIGLPATPVWLAGAGLALCAMLRSAKNWDELAMPIAVTSILAVPYAVPHDLVTALPWCASLLLRRDRDWRQAAAALIFSAVIVPIAAAALAIGWVLSPGHGQADRIPERKPKRLR